LTNVLGLPLNMALEVLEREGVTVNLQEARSKKGVQDGIDSRVIRQECHGEARATLVYAVFRTEPNEANA
jgi:hypothetical protein